MAILSYGHADGGNELLFNLGDAGELAGALGPIPAGDGSLRRYVPFFLPFPIAIPAGRANPSFRMPGSADLTFAEPADTRDSGGLAVDGTVLVEFNSCFLAVIPEASLTLRVAVMRGDLQIVIPVRPTALLALVVLDKTDCKRHEGLHRPHRQGVFEARSFAQCPQRRHTDHG